MISFLGFIVAFILGVAGFTHVMVSVPEASIGGTIVPSLTCQEDEVIAFIGIDTLDCVHIDIIRGE